MFICTACIKKNFNNSPSIFRSHGNCEYCGKDSDCSEIQSSLLKKKEYYNPLTGVILQNQNIES